jgi:ATP-binding cassette subfamily B protein
LGRALLASGTRIALLDEPFRGMDRGQREALLGEARRWWRDVTLLCVTHDVGETLAFDRVLVIEDGRIVEDGRPAALAAGATRYNALLAAERNVHETFWQGNRWRHLRVVDGQVRETGVIP